MIKALCTCAVLCVRPPFLYTQGSAGTTTNVEPRFLVDIPTAGMLPQAGVGLDVDFYQQGGVLVGVGVGILDRLSIGVSYGGSGLIGDQQPDMNNYPGVSIKLRPFEESDAFPALAFGFDSQGRDGWLDDLDRYRVKSPGFYAALSRNYAWFGYFSLHGGVNYSMEHGDGDQDVNFTAGLEKSLGNVFSTVLEYNLGLNDSDHDAIGKGRGYLNAGLRWSAGGGLTLALHFKDLLQNARGVDAINRTFRLEYAKFF